MSHQQPPGRDYGINSIRALVASGAKTTIKQMVMTGLMTLLAGCRALATPPPGSTHAARHFETVTVNNLEPRRATDGNILDAHDGCLQFFDGRY